jgi:hypothetical protein
MTGVLSFLSIFFQFALLLFKEFFSKQAAEEAAAKQVKFDEAAFMTLASAVLLKIKAKALTESEQAQTMEEQVAQSLKDREKKS